MGYQPFTKTIYPLFIFVVMTLVGCGVPQSSSDFDKTPEAQFLKATVSQVVSKDYAAIEALMDSRVIGIDISKKCAHIEGEKCVALHFSGLRGDCVCCLYLCLGALLPT